MQTLSKNKAIIMATECVGRPSGRDDRWRFIAPQSVRNLAGPTHEYKATNYPDIQRMRTLFVVEIALVLMGMEGRLRPDGLEGSVKSMIERVLESPGKYLIKGR